MMTNSTPTMDELEKLLGQLHFGFARSEILSAPQYEKGVHTVKINKYQVRDLKQAIHRYAQQMVVEELKSLNKNVATDKCCPIHHNLIDRIATIEKEMEKK